MKLFLSSSIGRGNTEFGAFDAALACAGVANFNLIRAGMVIPPNGEIVQVARCPLGQDGRWGDRLYAVYAEQRTSVPGAQVWAGVGWVRDAETGQGLFVEHGGGRQQDVKDQLAASLRDLQLIRNLESCHTRTRVIGAMCSGAPTCALVICTFGTETWPASAADFDGDVQPSRRSIRG